MHSKQYLYEMFLIIGILCICIVLAFGLLYLADHPGILLYLLGG